MINCGRLVIGLVWFWPRAIPAWKQVVKVRELQHFDHGQEDFWKQVPWRVAGYSA